MVGHHLVVNNAGSGSWCHGWWLSSLSLHWWLWWLWLVAMVAIVTLVVMVADGVVAGGHCHCRYCGGDGGIGGGWWWLLSSSWWQLLLLGVVVAESTEVVVVVVTVCREWVISIRKY